MNRTELPLSGWFGVLCLAIAAFVYLDNTGSKHAASNPDEFHYLQIARLTADTGHWLPLQAASVDVVVLPHGLEFEADPHGVLREIERVLMPEGYLLTFGFNPWSLYGLWRVATGWRGDYPWRGRFIPLGRLQEWLAVLGFETARSAGLSFRPPLQRPGAAQHFEWVERLGRHFLPFLGNVYWLLARKRVPAARPIRALRARRRRLRSGAVVETGSRRLFDSVKDPNDG
jgi:SAM-dependent methyltransferase